MQIILKENVENLGFKDDLVNVKNGFGNIFACEGSLRFLNGELNAVSGWDVGKVGVDMGRKREQRRGRGGRRGALTRGSIPRHLLAPGLHVPSAYGSILC